MNLTSESLVGAQSLAMSISARLPRIGSPGTGRLDVGQQRVDPLVAGLAMVIPLADQRERALERGAAAQEEDRGVVMRVEDGPSERRVLAAGKLLRGALLGRPETDWCLSLGCAIAELGNGLHLAEHYEDALTVREAELATMRRVGAPEENVLIAQSNLASTYHALERFEESNCVLRDVYSGRLKLYGKEHERTLIAANNYANSLVGIDRFEEAKSLLRETVPVTQRVLGANHDFTLRMRSSYAHALYNDPSASLDDLREAVTTLEDAERIARRVLGGAHPVMVDMERSLRVARAALRAREAQPGEA